MLKSKNWQRFCIKFSMSKIIYGRLMGGIGLKILDLATRSPEHYQQLIQFRQLVQTLAKLSLTANRPDRAHPRSRSADRSR